jgi:regulator of ribonuclease activity A
MKPTCDICDDFRDTPEAEASGRFIVLPPVFRDFGAQRHFNGPVSTVRCFEDNSLVKAAVDAPGQGRVLVVDGGGSLRHALLGGNLGAAAARNGWAGVLIDGCVRDVDELAVLPIGIRALAAVPRPPAKRGEGQRDVPVRVQGLWVTPGMWLVADSDGAVLLHESLWPGATQALALPA